MRAEASTAPRSLARFELLRVLGRGAQATVWLAHDPRLDRDVAVKLLDAAADAMSVSQWLDEARAVSRLAHPNIVPVFEADEVDGQPYLVFEYVAGPTLSQARQQRPVWPAREAVELVRGVLDALAAAHGQGIVHRDLKPSNVLLGCDGRPRVMDFGIAARLPAATDGRSLGRTNGRIEGRIDGRIDGRTNGPTNGRTDGRTDGRIDGVQAGADGRVVGTPGYMSPEAARGEAPAPAMDVFAAGVMLGELLSGRPLLNETNALRAVQRVQHEDLLLPVDIQIDDGLRGIVQRALSRDARARYDGARSMHSALSAWLDGADPAPADLCGQHGTLDFLLRRMRHKTDFPALSESVVRIQRVATSETESLASLSSEILKDVALTNKLLRMVNTAHFSQAAGGGVSTVSRAVALVGFAGIRNMALSVVLLEHMGDKAHANQLKEEFVRALMTGMLASELATVSREGEEAFLASMFQSLGRLLTEYYFAEEAVQIRQRLPAEGASPAEREAAAVKVLGIGFEELGAGVARAWGLPDSLQRAMRSPEGDAPSRPANGAVDRLRWLGRSANALTDALLISDPLAQQQALAAVAERHAAVLGMSMRDILARTQESRTRLSQMTQAMGLSVPAGAPARRLLDSVVRGGAAPKVAALPDRTLVQGRPSAAAPTGVAPPAGVALAEGLQSITRAVAGGQTRLNDVLRMVLETMHLAMDFRCVVFCLRDARSGQLTGRFGLGSDAASVSAAFRVTPSATAASDLFGALCSRGADTLIADAGSASVAQRLPAWYRQSVAASTFLLLPLMLKGAPFGLIYADKARAGSIVLGDQDLGLLKSLRDQAVAAFARASG